ncbi:MAG TPA: hypothetical protein VHK69_13010 [Chitinophagaceae bacterium]|jgi:hypothetical protein|nr:hypothetical protein [Chitinophagaceae bacterium]
MAACNFNIPFSGSAEQVLQKAKTTVQGQGGTFEGDAQAGSFSVSVFGNSIAGSYTVSGQSLAIVIDSKPFLVSCGMIEGFLKSQLGG